MIQLIKTVSVLAALMAVIGTFTVYGIGRTTDLAKGGTRAEETRSVATGSSRDAATLRLRKTTM